MIDIVNKLTSYKHRPKVKDLESGSVIMNYNLVGSNLNSELKGKKDIVAIRCNMRYASFPSWLIILDCVGQKNRNPKATKTKKDFKERARNERGKLAAVRDNEPLGPLAGIDTKQNKKKPVPAGLIIDNLNLCFIDLSQYEVPPGTMFYACNFVREKQHTKIFPGRTDIFFLDCNLKNCDYDVPPINIIGGLKGVHEDVDFSLPEGE